MLFVLILELLVIRWVYRFYEATNMFKYFDVFVSKERLWLHQPSFFFLFFGFAVIECSAFFSSGTFYRACTLILDCRFWSRWGKNAFSTNLLWRPPVFESFLLHVFMLLFILVPFHDFYQATKCVNLIRYLKNFSESI